MAKFTFDEDGASAEFRWGPNKRTVVPTGTFGGGTLTMHYGITKATMLPVVGASWAAAATTVPAASLFELGQSGFAKFVLAGATTPALVVEISD
jgi:hypothetical protein